MSHRDPEDRAEPLWVRRNRSRPYEIAILLVCVVIAVSIGLHRKAEREHLSPSPPAEAGRAS